MCTLRGGSFRSGHDLIDCHIDLDRRMIDFLVGIETELDQLIEGGSCYFPTVTWDRCVLPVDTKSLLESTVKGYQKYRDMLKTLDFQAISTYGNGCILLFHGPSGSGKTLTANALVNSLGKRILVINVPKFFSDAGAEAFKFVFREAKIQDAVVFLDECEPLFVSRDKGKSHYEVNEVLTEIERFDGIMIMATTRPHDLDSAMWRRISLNIEFENPSSNLREQIWRKHIPPKLLLGADVDVKALAREFSLNGGFIKNAMLQALRFAVVEQEEVPPEKVVVLKSIC